MKIINQLQPIFNFDTPPFIGYAAIKKSYAIVSIA